MNKIEQMFTDMKEQGRKPPIIARIGYWIVKKIALSSGVSQAVLDEELDNRVNDGIKKQRRGQENEP